MTDAAAAQTLRLLHLENSPRDHARAMAHLRRAGHHVDALRVDTVTAFRQALAEHDWDVLLSDFDLPGVDGLQAQSILQDSGLDIPFILVCGAIGEDAAMAAMRNGASDCLLKSHLARLAPAVLQAVAAQRERRARQHADRKLAASRQRLSELAQHLQTSIEMERAAIAREIHDDVGGALTAIGFDIAWIGRHVPQPEVQQRVANALEAVTHAIESSQRIMHNLRPAILEQGLAAALQWIASRFEKRTGTPCVVRLPRTAWGSSETPDLPAGVPLVAYRTAQEALTNISKHAQATSVQIDLSLAGGVLSLEISDNGRGLGAADLEKARSFGIRGLHERAGTVGGWVELSSRPGGTSLILSVPLGLLAPGSAELRSGPIHDADDHSQWGTL